MAETDRTKTGSDGQTAAPKRREELDAILQRIAEHIAEVDRKQGAAPGKATPGPAGPGPSLRRPDAATLDPRPIARPAPAEADQAMPDAVATEHEAGAVARAGAGDSTAEVWEKPFVQPPAAEAAAGTARRLSLIDEDPAMATNEPDDFVERPEAVSSPPRVRSATSEPPALRSALRQPQAATAPPRRVSLRETTPPAKPAPATPLAATDDADSDPWDSQSAEALAKAYEAEAAIPPLRSVLDVMAQPATQASATPRRTEPEIHIPAAAPTSLIDNSALREASFDGALAEARLGEIAQRVEAALDRLAPREMVETLGQRFHGLEMRVAGTHEQLARLDGIESSVAELGSKLTDEHVIALFGNLVPTAEDLAQFAEDAAGKAADRVLEAYAQEMTARPSVAPTKDTGTSLEIKALRELIGAYMDDRRRSDAGTQEALETLQLAMQHLLDRVDPDDVAAEPAIDDGFQPAQPAAIPAPVRPAVAAAPMSAAGQLIPDVSHYHYDPEHDRLGAGEPQDLDAVPHANSYNEAVRAPQTMPAAQPVATPTMGSGYPAAQYSPQHAPEHAAAHDHDAEPRAAAAAAGHDRQAFIAHARKAAEKAKAEGDAKSAGEQGAKARGFRTQVAGAVAGAPTAGVRPGVLVVTSLAAFLLAGYWFIASPKLGLSDGSPTAARQEEAAEPRRERTPQSTRSQPDVETDEPVRSGGPRGGQLPGKANKTADDVQPASTDKPTEEARVIDGPIEPGALGIALAQSATPPTVDAMLRARNQQHLASLSHRTAFNAAEQHAASATSATSTLETSDATPAVPAAPAAAVDTTRLELPPAALGPLSLRVAAAKGDASAQLEIATRYAEGKGVKQSFQEAVTWYQRAAMQGLAVAQYRLATLQERGMGVKADAGRARIWYQRAAEQGNLKAMHNLAVLSASPANGTPDYDTAAKLFTDAAERGLADSQYNLAILAESGLGMQKDLVAAYKWYTLAAKAGDQDAGRRRDQLIARLTQDMIQTGDKQLAAWRPGPADRFANDARVASEAWKQSTATVSAGTRR